MNLKALRGSWAFTPYAGGPHFFNLSSLTLSETIGK